MNTPHPQTSACRHCQHYEPEGRRGGYCKQLSVAVQGAWSACALAIPPFSPTWENFEDIMLWQKKTLAAMEESVLVESLDTRSHSQTHSETVEVSQPLSDRATSEQSFNSASSQRMARALPTEPQQQVMGIKALWM
jgi:hypothetical protein